MVLCVDSSMLPILGGLLGRLEHPDEWSDEESWLQGYQWAAERQEELATACFQNLVDELRALRGLKPDAVPDGQGQYATTDYYSLAELFARLQGIDSRTGEPVNLTAIPALQGEFPGGWFSPGDRVTLYDVYKTAATGEQITVTTDDGDFNLWDWFTDRLGEAGDAVDLFSDISEIIDTGLTGADLAADVADTALDGSLDFAQLLALLSQTYATTALNSTMSRAITKMNTILETLGAAPDPIGSISGYAAPADNIIRALRGDAAIDPTATSVLDAIETHANDVENALSQSNINTFALNTKLDTLSSETPSGGRVQFVDLLNAINAIATPTPDYSSIISAMNSNTNSIIAALNTVSGELSIVKQDVTRILAQLPEQIAISDIVSRMDMLLADMTGIDNALATITNQLNDVQNIYGRVQAIANLLDTLTSVTNDAQRVQLTDLRTDLAILTQIDAALAPLAQMDANLASLDDRMRVLMLPTNDGSVNQIVDLTTIGNLTYSLIQQIRDDADNLYQIALDLVSTSDVANRMQIIDVVNAIDNISVNVEQPDFSTILKEIREVQKILVTTDYCCDGTSPPILPPENTPDPVPVPAEHCQRVQWYFDTADSVARSLLLLNSPAVLTTGNIQNIIDSGATPSFGITVSQDEAFLLWTYLDAGMDGITVDTILTTKRDEIVQALFLASDVQDARDRINLLLLPLQDENYYLWYLLTMPTLINALWQQTIPANAAEFGSYSPNGCVLDIAGCSGVSVDYNSLTHLWCASPDAPVWADLARTIPALPGDTVRQWDESIAGLMSDDITGVRQSDYSVDITTGRMFFDNYAIAGADGFTLLINHLPGNDNDLIERMSPTPWHFELRSGRAFLNAANGAGSSLTLNFPSGSQRETLAFVYDAVGLTGKVFRDGVLIASGTAPSSLKPTTADLMIDGNDIKEIRIHNRPLTDSEVATETGNMAQF
jgi:hypothetical protein